MDVTLYRAMSTAELSDIRATGQFRPGPNSIEGKWFSETEQGARLWSGAFAQTEGIVYHVVRASVPEELFVRLFTIQNLDGFANARYVPEDELKQVRFLDEVT